MTDRPNRPEAIATKLRHVELLQEQGKPVCEALRQIGMTERTYHRWRQQYGGLDQDEIRWMRQLMEENRWLGATLH